MEKEEIKETTEEEKKNKPKKKNKKANKIKIRATIIALALIGAGISLKENPKDLSDKTFIEVTNENSDNSYMNEMLELDDTIGVTNMETNELEQIQVEDAISNLETNINDYNEIQELSISENTLNELSEEDKQLTISIINENGLDYLIEEYNDAQNQVERARTAQKLLYYQSLLENYFSTNGIAITKSILNRTITSCILSAEGIDFNEYGNISITLNDSNGIKTATIEDLESGVNYTVIITPILSSQISHAYNLYGYLNGLTEEDLASLSIKDIIKYTEKGLNFSENCIESKPKHKNILGKEFIYLK